MVFQNHLTPKSFPTGAQFALEVEIFLYAVPTGEALSGAPLLPQLQKLFVSSRPVEEGDLVIGLTLASGGSISIEPGGQLEFASGIHPSLESLQKEITHFYTILDQVSQGKIAYLCHGTQPLKLWPNHLLLKKTRYQILDRYLNSQPGSIGLNMMRHTGTVQPNLDIPSQNLEQWQEHLFYLTALWPQLSEILSNSFFFDNKPVNNQRLLIWEKMDPSRTGLPPDSSLKSYVEWARKAYVWYIKDLPVNSQPLYGQITFDQWEEKGFMGIYPNQNSWEIHLSTLFPHIRLRKFFEIRFIDAQPLEFIFAPMALFYALFYTQEGLNSRSNLLHLKNSSALFNLCLKILEKEKNPWLYNTLKKYGEFMEERKHFHAIYKTGEAFVKDRGITKPQLF